jgi:hypothetical protein
MNTTWALPLACRATSNPLRPGIRISRNRIYSYSGSYSVRIYPGLPTSGTPFDEFNDTGAPLVAFTGTIVAHRVTAD